MRNLFLEHILGDISLFYGGKLAKETSEAEQGRETSRKLTSFPFPLPIVKKRAEERVAWPITHSV
jgi:hypothetical protein